MSPYEEEAYYAEEAIREALNDEDDRDHTDHEETTMLQALREQHEATKKTMLHAIKKLDMQAKAQNKVLTADQIVYLLANI